MAVLLVLVGFIAAGGGCVLTPAMVAIGVPGVITPMGAGRLKMLRLGRGVVPGIAPFLAPSSC